MLDSIEDKIGDSRMKTLSRAIFLNDIRAKIVYAVKQNDVYSIPKKLMPRMFMSIDSFGAFGLSFPWDSIEDMVMNRLQENIEHYKPEYIILLAGFVFSQYKDQLISALSRIHDEHPEISIGIISRKHDCNHYKSSYPDVFDVGDATLELEKALKKELFT